jgi:hypothetical protein
MRRCIELLGDTTVLPPDPAIRAGLLGLLTAAAAAAVPAAEPGDR